MFCDIISYIKQSTSSSLITVIQINFHCNNIKSFNLVKLIKHLIIIHSIRRHKYSFYINLDTRFDSCTVWVSYVKNK